MQEIDDSKTNENVAKHQESKNSDHKKENHIRRSSRNLNHTQNKFAHFESDSDGAKLAALEDSGSDFEDTLKKKEKSYVSGSSSEDFRLIKSRSKQKVKKKKTKTMCFIQWHCTPKGNPYRIHKEGKRKC